MTYILFYQYIRRFTSIKDDNPFTLLNFQENAYIEHVELCAGLYVTSNFLDDELGKKFLSYIWVNMVFLLLT